jgi:hypothetical protein
MGVTFATRFGPALAAAHWRWFVRDRDAPQNPASFLIRKNHYQTCLRVNYTPQRFRVNRGDMSWRTVAAAMFVIASMEPPFHASPAAQQAGERAGEPPGGRQGAPGGGGRGGGLATKNPELPAGAGVRKSALCSRNRRCCSGVSGRCLSASSTKRRTSQYSRKRLMRPRSRGSNAFVNAL